MQRFLISAVLLVTLALAASCGGGDGGNGGDIFPLQGNSEFVTGPMRFAFGLADEDNRRILKTSDEAVHLQLSFGGEVKEDVDTNFVWAIPDVSGFWTADVNFDGPGTWEAVATLTRGGDESSVTFTFPVAADSAYPNIGDTPPATENATLATEPNIKKLTTDPEPDLDLYQLSIADALEAHKPFVVVFATPAFCTTQFCGPVVDNVKAVKQDAGDSVNFIHIEPYELDDEGQLVTDDQNLPIAAEPTQEWDLQTEPWVFIVGSDGKVVARFESAVSVEELQQALQQVS